MDDIERPVIPEKESMAVLKALRKRLPKVPMSVSGYISKSGTRGIHIAADNPNDPEDLLDLKLAADKGVERLTNYAYNKIVTRFFSN